MVITVARLESLIKHGTSLYNQTLACALDEILDVLCALRDDGIVQVKYESTYDEESLIDSDSSDELLIDDHIMRARDLKMDGF